MSEPTRHDIVQKALKEVIEALQHLNPQERTQVTATVKVFLDIKSPKAMR